MDGLKIKLSAIVARIIIWALFGSPGPGERTIDQAIAEHKRMLNLLPISDQYEIIRGLVSWRYPDSHLHGNPKPKKKGIKDSTITLRNGVTSSTVAYMDEVQATPTA